MDKRTAATIAGSTALLSELVRILVEKRIISKDEIIEVVTEVIVRGQEADAESGFDAAPRHLLKIIQNW